jgi:preprotein translocase subunit YajC
MIGGLEPLVFFAFLSWPFTYIIIAIIMYFCMARSDKKEEAWEQAFEKWQKELPEKDRIAQMMTQEGGEGE